MKQGLTTNLGGNLFSKIILKKKQLKINRQNIRYKMNKNLIIFRLLSVPCTCHMPRAFPYSMCLSFSFIEGDRFSQAESLFVSSNKHVVGTDCLNMARRF